MLRHSCRGVPRERTCVAQVSENPRKVDERWEAIRGWERRGGRKSRGILWMGLKMWTGVQKKGPWTEYGRGRRGGWVDVCVWVGGRHSGIAAAIDT